MNDINPALLKVGIDWLSDWLIEWMIDWLIDWLIALCYIWNYNELIKFLSIGFRNGT